MAVSYLGSDAADSISAKRKSYSRFIFNAIPKGWYRLEIHSVFGHNFHHKVLIEEKEKEVKLDGPSHYYKTIRNANFLNEKLKIGDTLFILFTPSEMMAQKEKIAVVKLKAGLKAIQYEGSSDKVFQDMLSDNSKINLVANAEMEMRLQSKPNPAASPAVEYYTFELNKELETFTLPKGFHGMDKIKAVLFIIENK